MERHTNLAGGLSLWYSNRSFTTETGTTTPPREMNVLVFLAIIAALGGSVQLTCALVSGEPIYWFIAAAFFIMSFAIAFDAWFSR